MLGLDDHEVAIAQNGADAISRLKSETFDVVITDLGMPDITGWDVAREAKQWQADVRVGLVTGWGGELGDIESMRALGVDFVVSKPYRISTLRGAILESLQTGTDG
jgi:CheY-like chemotaxis protein